MNKYLNLDVLEVFQFCEMGLKNSCGLKTMCTAPFDYTYPKDKRPQGTALRDFIISASCKFHHKI